MEQIDREIKQGTFDYAKYFPNSSNLKRLAQAKKPSHETVAPGAKAGAVAGDTHFAEEWYQENEVSWKISYQETIRGTLDKHLVLVFWEKEVSHITKGDIPTFSTYPIQSFCLIADNTGLLCPFFLWCFCFDMVQRLW